MAAVCQLPPFALLKEYSPARELVTERAKIMQIRVDFISFMARLVILFWFGKQMILLSI